MKLSHQSHSWDRMTQINKTESFGTSRQTLETPEPTWAGIRGVTLRLEVGKREAEEKGFLKLTLCSSVSQQLWFATTGSVLFQ